MTDIRLLREPVAAGGAAAVVRMMLAAEPDSAFDAAATCLVPTSPTNVQFTERIGLAASRPRARNSLVWFFATRVAPALSP